MKDPEREQGRVAVPRNPDVEPPALGGDGAHLLDGGLRGVEEQFPKAFLVIAHGLAIDLEDVAKTLHPRVRPPHQQKVRPQLTLLANLAVRLDDSLYLSFFADDRRELAFVLLDVLAAPLDRRRRRVRHLRARPRRAGHETDGA